MLGRGGFGLVVAAINRLDGRQYAVKKIPLDATTPAAFNRIIREVSTLSRLQHPHVRSISTLFSGRFPTCCFAPS